MSAQDILFYIGVASIALAVLLGGGAAYLFFTYNIPDLLDDLSGKKRADAIARMSEPGTGTLRRRSKAKADSKTPAAQPSALVPGTGELYAAAEAAAEARKAKEAPAQSSEAKKDKKGKKATAPSNVEPTYIPQLPDEDPEATSVIAGEEAPTTVMDGEEAVADAQPTSSDETTQAPEEELQVEEPEEKEPAQDAPRKPDWFRLVQRIVLTESTDYVQVERGEGHA